MSNDQPQTPDFTSGPWHVTGDRLVYSGSDFIADCEFGGYPAGDPRIMEQQANARLIAAAPQMFHTLEQIVRMWDDPEQNDLNDMIVAATFDEANAILATVREEASHD